MRVGRPATVGWFDSPNGNLNPTLQVPLALVLMVYFTVKYAEIARDLLNFNVTK